MEEMIMNIVKYDPFRELRGIQDEMTRLFTGLAPVGSDRDEVRYGAWNPSVDKKTTSFSRQNFPA